MTDPHESTLHVVNTAIDAQAERAAGVWREDISKIVHAASTEWHAKHSEVPADLFADLYQPALLWKFCTHLAKEMIEMAELWEQIFYANLKERP